MVSDDDAHYQRILWRESPEDNIQHYRLLTVTYGTSSAPYLATKTLQKLSEESVTKFPAASIVLNRDFYVDDLMSGSSNLLEASQLQHDVTEKLLQTIPLEQRETKSITISEDNCSIKILGIKWDPRN